MAIKAVLTPADLLIATVAGSRHIEIRRHLDLSLLPSLYPSEGPSRYWTDVLLGAVPSTILSIRVRPQPLCLNTAQ
jgi:hypothetical protein